MNLHVFACYCTNHKIRKFIYNIKKLEIKEMTYQWSILDEWNKIEEACMQRIATRSKNVLLLQINSPMQGKTPFLFFQSLVTAPERWGRSPELTIKLIMVFWRGWMKHADHMAASNQDMRCLLCVQFSHAIICPPFDDVIN